MEKNIEKHKVETTYIQPTTTTTVTIYITLSLLTLYIYNTLLFSFQHLPSHSQELSPQNLNPVSNAAQIEKIKFKNRCSDVLR